MNSAYFIQIKNSSSNVQQWESYSDMAHGLEDNIFLLYRVQAY